MQEPDCWQSNFQSPGLDSILNAEFAQKHLASDDPKSAVIMLSLHKAAEEVTRYSFIGGDAFMLSESIPDEKPDHYTSRDDRSMRVICMNTMWHLFSDLMNSLRSFVPNPNE